MAVEIPLVGDDRHKNWAKIVYTVDPSKASGWAFEGDFIHPGGIQDVPIASVIVVYGERGSRTNPQVEAKVFVANADTTLSEHGTAKGKAWARTLRDTVAGLLDQQPTTRSPGPDLSWFSDQTLAEELARRGWTVNAPTA